MNACSAVSPGTGHTLGLPKPREPPTSPNFIQCQKSPVAFTGKVSKPTMALLATGHGVLPHLHDGVADRLLQLIGGNLNDQTTLVRLDRRAT